MSAPDLCTRARSSTVSGYYETLPIYQSALIEASLGHITTLAEPAFPDVAGEEGRMAISGAPR
jgi:hypothetical protein